MMKPRQTKAAILIVDDVPANRAAFEAILADLGHDLIVASSGEEALKILLRDDREYAVVLLDVQMPDLDGFETAEMIRQRERLRSVPILFLTAFLKSDEHLSKGYALGAVDYLFKPVVPEILRAKVAVLVDLWRTREELLELQRREHEHTVREVRGEYEARERDREKERLRFFAMSGDMLAIVGSDGHIRECNPAFSRTLGIQDLIDRSFVDLFHPVDRSMVRTQFRRLADGMNESTFEAKVLSGSGEVLWVAWNAAGFAKEGRLYVVGRDITARKRQEDELTALKDQLAGQVGELTRLHEMSTRLSSNIEVQPALQDILEQALSVVGSETGTLSLYEPEQDALQLAAYTGIRPGIVEAYRTIKSGEGSAGKCLEVRQRIVVADVESDPLCEAQRVTLRQAGVRAVFSTPLLTRDGAAIGVLSCHFPKPHVPTDPEMRLVELYAHQTARFLDNARLLRQAQEAVHTREEFLSVASHELKTPLTALQLHLQGLIREIQREGDQTTASKRWLSSAQAIKNQGDRLNKLINNLLDVSRISAGKMSLEIEEVDLCAAVRSVLDRFRTELVEKRIEASFENGRTVVGRWDRLRIEQVITNLISNAIKYGNGKPIRISLKQRGDNALLTVRDEGIGITQQFRKRIFRPFERGVSPGHYGGLGLGLYIVHQILDAHGGTIAIDSDPGHGTAVTIELPRSSSRVNELMVAQPARKP